MNIPISGDIVKHFFPSLFQRVHPASCKTVYGLFPPTGGIRPDVHVGLVADAGPKNFDPEGRSTIAQRFIAGEENVTNSKSVPEGRLNGNGTFQSSLRDFSGKNWGLWRPSSEQDYASASIGMFK
jgi:hypothetical protein